MKEGIEKVCFFLHFFPIFSHFAVLFYYLSGTKFQNSGTAPNGRSNGVAFLARGLPTDPYGKTPAEGTRRVSLRRSWDDPAHARSRSRLLNSPYPSAI